MAGHSHWAGIKHKKAAVDAKRSKLWSKLSKAIIVAAKLGGGDPDANPRLRAAIQDAKAASMPKDNIERAIKRGTGEIEGGEVEELVYEGYGPGGVAIMCDIMTDNRNRTAPELRKLFEVHGGNLGGSGCVAYLFDRKGIIVLNNAAKELERIMEIALEYDAEDIEPTGDAVEVRTAPEKLSDLQAALEEAGFEIEMAQVARIPQTTVDVDEDTAKKVLKLLEALDDHDDVQNVATNLNFDNAAIAELLSSSS